MRLVMRLGWVCVGLAAMCLFAWLSLGTTDWALAFEPETQSTVMEEDGAGAAVATDQSSAAIVDEETPPTVLDEVAPSAEPDVPPPSTESGVSTRLSDGDAESAPDANIAVEGGAPTEQTSPVGVARPGPAAASSAPKSPGSDSVANPEGEHPAVALKEDKMIHPAELNGVRPGEATQEDVEAAWGLPKKVGQTAGLAEHHYNLEPFQLVIVTYENERVARISVALKELYAPEAVAQELNLGQIKSVELSSELGQALGVMFPERGVFLQYAPGAGAQVAQIVLEPIAAEPFVLRADEHIHSHYQASLWDLSAALKIEPKYAGAYWRKARVLHSIGHRTKALEAAKQAIELEPENNAFRLTLAQLLEDSGDYAGSLEEIKRVLSAGELEPVLKARAYCQLGDLMANGPNQDYAEAVEFHAEAIKIAQRLATDRRLAIRQPAREVLLDAHLGMANDIAWGHWNDKEAATLKWLDKAAALPTETSSKLNNDAARFQISKQALAAHVGLQGQADPSIWTKSLMESGNSLMAAAQDPLRKREIEWELGLALYDILQIEHMRGAHDSALKAGQAAVNYLQSGSRERESNSAHAYLLGRLYFRIGVIHARHHKNHAQAVTWFDKATPLLSQPLPKSAVGNIGRQGETLVSMGVSYWEIGKLERAAALTRQGHALMKQAVQDGRLTEDSMTVATRNLSQMEAHLANADASSERIANKEDAAKRK